MSRNVVGSSSSIRSVPWARAIAIHTRWRWPPDSSSTERGRRGRSCRWPRAPPRRPPRRRATTAGTTRWCGVPAAGDEVGDGDALGRDRRLRQEAERRATSLVGRRWIASPSSSTVPALRLQQPGQGAQQRRLAAGVGADDHGDLAVGDLDDRGRRRPRGRRRRASRSARQRRRRLIGRSASAVGRGTSSHSRYGRAETAVTMPTGQLGRSEHAAGDEVGDTQRASAPTQRGRHDAGAGRRRQAAGDRAPRRRPRRRSVRRPRWRQRRQARRRRRISSSRVRSTRDAERRGGVVAELEQSQRPLRAARRSGTSTARAIADRAHLVPAAAVEAPVSHTAARWAS